MLYEIKEMLMAAYGKSNVAHVGGQMGILCMDFRQWPFDMG